MSKAQQDRAVPHEASVADTIIQELAAMEDVAPTDLSPPMYDVVDLDTIETLFRHEERTGDADLTLTFTYREYDVRVESPTDVSVTRRDAVSDS